ncbi:hypothetical protein [Campylobacter jejuni]|uniref:Uncharacterized protein n=1 Tax=Campylobacter jejuni TaxID=197 RepID=A0A431EEK5_CAMJU|nr:hypothetical protein [Campylobacter jejuni]RTJ79622.1 hypothetical protein C3H57_04425 [Campylobacter jejuni]
MSDIDKVKRIQQEIEKLCKSVEEIKRDSSSNRVSEMCDNLLEKIDEKMIEITEYLEHLESLEIQKQRELLHEAKEMLKTVKPKLEELKKAHHE